MRSHLALPHTLRRSQGSTQALLVLLLATAILSFSPALVRLAQNAGMPSLVITAGRLLLASLVITPLALKQYRAQIRAINRRDLLLAALAGFWMCVGNLGVIASLEMTTVLSNQVLSSTNPLWVAILEIAILKARLPRALWIGIALVIVGSVIISLSAVTGGEAAAQIGADEQHGSILLGDALALFGAMANAVYFIIGRKIRHRFSIIPFIWIVYGFGGLTGLAFAFFSGTTITGYTGTAYFWLLIAALLPQLFGHSGVSYTLAYLPATLVSLVTRVSVVASALIALLLFQEVPQPLQILGGLPILLGIGLAILARPSKAASA